MSFFEIGKIINTQGLHGDIRVLPSTDDPTRFSLLDEVDVFLKNKTLTLTIERARYHKQFVILKFKGIDTIEAADKLKRGVIKIPPEKALPLSDNEYYIRDLFGLNVISDEGEDLGVLSDILFTGANDVYVVKNTKGETLLIPAIRQCILNVNVDGGTMTVKLMEGLRETKELKNEE